MTTIDNHSPTVRTPIRQRLTYPSNTPQFTTPPYNSFEELQKLYRDSLSVLTTINETLGTNIPQTYSNAIPYDPTVTQLHRQETP